jgi:hypothetical protein
MEYRPNRCALDSNTNITGKHHMNRRTIPCLFMTAVTLSLGSLAGLAAQATGDLWQVTPQMQMPGMTMPLPPQQVCSAKQWTAPPAGRGLDATCVNSDFAMSGAATATWKVTCQSPPSTGTGEITRMGADAWKGTSRYNSAQGEMTINLSATRLGDCNP